MTNSLIFGPRHDKSGEPDQAGNGGEANDDVECLGGAAAVTE
jgi:hypothetical protein